MSEKNLKVGQKVEVVGKNVTGEIAFIGMTTFATGKWIGVILNEPVGKNNGTLKGTVYFSCAENCGMFVRPTQLVVLDDAGNPVEMSTSGEKTTRSRLSTSGSVRSVASTRPTTSRLSLASSRQSLLGSRSQLASQLASPDTERSVPAPAMSSSTSERTEKKSSISPPEYSSASKRESFVETGFLETLRPQFTPGQSITSPAISAEDKLNALQQQQHIEELKSQIVDLTEKLETIRQRRSEDKERLKEFDKMKTQFEQLQEFKSKIMDAQSQLQRELQRSRQETKDAIDARDQYVEEMSELAENMELITLDKEMAEEKSDTLQLELEASRERCEELQLDLDILKAEMQNKTGDVVAGSVTGGEGITSYEYKQLEQQNTRLRDTLVRLRDLSAHEKHEIQKIAKELETKKSEVNELQRTKKKLSAKIDELEAQVVDLQEQVDAALGAEEMVEQLGEKKMELEDKVKLLEEEVAELEALEEVHEQLVESNHELELDLREELDMALAAKRDVIRELDAATETILDRDQTIVKFRELVQKLNDQNAELRDRAATNEPVKQNAIAEAIDFKQVFAESKAHTRAIDLQLRQIELKQSNEHVRLLTAFMPETFLARGSDNDAVLVILLVSRIVFKAGIIVGQAKERFQTVDIIDRNAVVQGHAVQEFSFKSRLLHHVHNLQAVMHQFLYGLNVSTPETLLKAGASLPEMIAQEKVIDGVVELLKANQLDENSSTDNLEKCVTFFNAMYSVLLANDNLTNEVQLVRDYTASITACCDALATDSASMQALLQGGDEAGESGQLLQYVVDSSSTMKQQLKLIKRRLPQDDSVIKSGLSSKTLTNLKQANEQLGRAMTAIFISSKLVLQSITLDGETDVSISNERLLELLSASFEKVYEQDDRGPNQNLKTCLSATNTEMSQLAQYLLDNEYEILSMQSTISKPTAPIALRAQFIKKQLEETKTLTANLENREAEIRQLKLAAKMKQSELSEMQIRKDLAEKKLSVLQNDHEINTDKLQRKYDETLQLLKKKEKEFEETMDHLQCDIDSLENERGQLREKLKAYGTKKGDLKASTAFDITAGSPYIAQELALLKKAFNDERSERLKLQASEMKKVLSNLTPIYVPQPKDNRIIELEKDLAKVKYDYIMSLAKGAEFPGAQTKTSNISKLLSDHQNKQKILRQEIKNRVEHLASNVLDEYFQRKPYRATNGDFSKFATPELTRALRSN
ncbi:dynactin subunit 1 isoform X2 [Bradysia coprophila]|uniref:dynactin subunit 1 isoform X2 n=1 Tax=Bradysia coprophila TaxID=38358 RepID=UPI00187D8C24|nr:dynactin subunit 1 isoform X2 [Bradysia coprophila]